MGVIVSPQLSAMLTPEREDAEVSLQGERAQVARLREQIDKGLKSLRGNPLAVTREGRERRRRLKRTQTLVQEGNLKDAILGFEEHMRQESQHYYGEGTNVLEDLRDLVKIAPARPLPGPLGGLTRVAFLDAVMEEPTLFRDMLLAQPWEGVSPEESLQKMLQLARDVLHSWHKLYAARPQEELTPEQRRLRLCDELRQCMGMATLVVGYLAPVPREREPEVMAPYQRLLRWRLERCEDVCQLEPLWNLSDYAFHRGGYFMQATKTLEALQEALPATEALSVDTWDFLVERLLGHARRMANHSTREESSRQFWEGPHRAFLEMDDRAEVLAEQLLTLEGELAGMPREMCAPFLEGAWRQFLATCGAGGEGA